MCRDASPGHDRNQLIATPIEPREATMIRTGDTLTNPVTGEVIRFVETATDTNGEYVLVEVVVEPYGFVAAAHVHPYQTETFEILEGELTFKAGKETIVAEAGDTVRVDPGTPHKFWNAGETDARFRTEVRPALQFESLIETMFALAGDGKTNKKGMPNPLRLAVIANAHYDVVRLPFPPAWMQKLGLMLGAPLGRLVGYQPTYAPAEPSEVAAAV
jgi:quercetin dioxygenase-like cupin family protein